MRCRRRRQAGGANRAVDFYTVSINNISRVEVTKVPTPDSPADSLGGSVNMISKSAFENSRREFRYRAYVSMNNEDREVFRRTPGPGDKSTYKVLPGFDFNYIIPASSTFGLVINGLSSNQFNERTHDRGEGPLIDPDAPFQRNAGGGFVLVNGARVRKPEAGAAGSLQELALVRRERAGRAARTYDGYYPSLHATFNLSDDLVARFAYAKTLGRPEFNNVIPNTTIDEADTPPAPGGSPGSIALRNTGLKPWSADNWDLSLEYYFGKGGVISAGAFRKDLQDFWGAVNRPLTPELAATLDIDPKYVGWNVSSLINAGSARVTGVEGNFTKTLYFIPRWGRYLSLQTNGTMLHLTGRNDADFSGFIARTGNIGLTFSKAPLVMMVKWNYRGRQKNGAQFGTAHGAYEYFDSRYYLDLNAEYAVTRHVTIFANARNVTNRPQNAERYSRETPGYSHLFRSEEYGVQMAFGLKGSF